MVFSLGYEHSKQTGTIGLNTHLTRLPFRAGNRWRVKNEFFRFRVVIGRGFYILDIRPMTQLALGVTCPNFSGNHPGEKVVSLLLAANDIHQRIAHDGMNGMRHLKGKIKVCLERNLIDVPVLVNLVLPFPFYVT